MVFNCQSIELHNQDLSDYLVDNDQKLGGPDNIIRLTISHARHFNIYDPSVLRYIFQGIGTWNEQRMNNDDIDQLSQYYLVSFYKPNMYGDAGIGIEGSINYRFDEYLEVLTNGSIQVIEKIQQIIYDLRQGLSKAINIIIALDSSLNKGIIIDANKRAIALSYLKHKEPKVFADLLKSTFPVNMVFMKSSVCRIIYPLDFLQLCRE
jgi:hypothetical protein